MAVRETSFRRKVLQEQESLLAVAKNRLAAEQEELAARAQDLERQAKELQHALDERKQYRIERAHINLAVEEIGRCLVDIGTLQQQGLLADNGLKRGGVSAGLQRAAYRVQHGTLEGFDFNPAKPPEKEITPEDYAIKPEE